MRVHLSEGGVAGRSPHSAHRRWSCSETCSLMRCCLLKRGLFRFYVLNCIIRCPRTSFRKKKWWPEKIRQNEFFLVLSCSRPTIRVPRSTFCGGELDFHLCRWKYQHTTATPVTKMWLTPNSLGTTRCAIEHTASGLGSSPTAPAIRVRGDQHIQRSSGRRRGSDQALPPKSTHPPLQLHPNPPRSQPHQLPSLLPPPQQQAFAISTARYVLCVVNLAPPHLFESRSFELGLIMP